MSIDSLIHQITRLGAQLLETVALRNELNNDLCQKLAESALPVKDKYAIWKAHALYNEVDLLELPYWFFDAYHDDYTTDEELLFYANQCEKEEYILDIIRYNVHKVVG